MKDLERSKMPMRTKSMKVLYSNSHIDRPKISMEGKWLEKFGFYIGDRLQVVYGNEFISISHAADDS